MNLAWFTCLRRLVIAAAFAATLQLPLHAQDQVPALVMDTARVLTSADWPPVSTGVSWEGEGGDRFVRLASPSPGALVTLGRDFILSAGTEALELSWRQRITNLKPGAQNGDARLVFEFFDTQKTRLTATPPFSFYRENSADWEPKASRVSVPAGARTFRLTLALVRVDSGSYDLSDISVAAVAGAPSSASSTGPTLKAPRTELPESGPPPIETALRQYWPAEIRVRGNRLVAGGREIWLQGLNVPSLEWSVRGERVERSIVVAIQDWNANVIRLPVSADHWFGKGKKYNTQDDGGAAYRQLVDQAIMLAANRGSYLVIDLHHYRAPRPEHLTFWTEVATLYKNHPAVLFGLLNEPHGTSWEVWRDGGFLEEKKKDGDEDAFLTPEEKLNNKRGYQSPGMQKMLDTVRATGAKNIVVVGGLDYAYSLTGILEGFELRDSSGNGILYDSHIYPWKKGWQKRVLDIAAKHPILLGEVGGDAKKMTWLPANHQEDVATWAPAILGLIQQYKLNWTGWCFHPKASPRMLLDWDYTPTPFWGQQAKDALSGKQFPPPDRLR